MIKELFHKKLSPLINNEYIFLLFMTATFHLWYFDGAHPVSRFLAADRKIPVVVYFFTALSALSVFIKIPDDWKRIVAWLLYIGSVFIGVVLGSAFYQKFSTPTVIEVFANVIYTCQALISLILIIMSFIEKPGHENVFLVEPHLGERPSPIIGGIIIAFVVIMTFLLHRVIAFGLEPEEITDYVTFSGFLIIQLYRMSKSS
jgi:hypothetical protein